MGTDYSSLYGIGVELVEQDFDDDNEFYDVDEYISSLPKMKGIELEYLEVGESMYTGVSNTFYLCIKDPFKDGIDSLKLKMKIFEKFLKDNNVEYKGKIDLVGGLLIH